ncbi:MAG: beta-lactamase family protein [Gemmatimonadota bacterium]|nr:MAG: beta-lactamase family protein [Gemmatimonadota bacterium]
MTRTRRPTTRILTTTSAVLPALVTLVATVPTALAVAQERPQEPPLRTSEPVASIVADLESYIPERLREAGVPGLSIALVHNFEVAWSAGFGVKNVITGGEVTEGTVFEVASISKVVTAYTALRLVDQGRLSLDEPVAAYLREPWLPPSDWADRITLRHLASHSSGLTDRLLPTDKTVTFRPGTEFLYSGVGAMYVQEIIERTTGQPLSRAAGEFVFEPLGMSSSNLVNTAAILRSMANGHMTYTLPLLTMLTAFVPSFVVLALLSVPVRRIRTGSWRPKGAWVAAAALAAALATLVILSLTMGRVLPNVAVLNAAVGTGFAAALIGLTVIGRHFIARSAAARQESGQRPVLVGIWATTCAVGLFLLSGSIHGPVPRGPSPRPSAVGTLRTAAPDLATFLIELARSRYVSEQLSEQVRTPQIRINSDYSWGLGPGIQHSEGGDALWQNGMTFGFRSVMVIYPEHGIGVVVLTNSERGFPLAYDVAARAIGGKDQLRYF